MTTHRNICRPTSTLSAYNNKSNNSSIQLEASNSKSASFKAPVFTPIKKVIPELDDFAKRRKRKNEEMDTELAAASSAISTAVNSVSALMVEQSHATRHGYILAIEEGLKSVPAKKKMQCMIEVFQVLQKYEEM